MGGHGLIAGIRGIPRIFAGIHKRDVRIYKFPGHTAFEKTGGDVFLVQVLYPDIKLVRDIAEQCLVQLLVECRSEILPEISGCGPEPCQGHLRGTPGPRPCHIGLSCSHSLENQPCGKSGNRQERERNPESRAVHHECPVEGIIRLVQDNEPDILPEILHILAVCGRSLDRLGILALDGAFLHPQVQCLGAYAHILACIHVVI